MLGLALWAGSLFAFWKPGSAAILSGTVTWKGHPVWAARIALPALRLRTHTDSLGRYSLQIPTSILFAPEAMAVSESNGPQGPLLRADGRIIPWPGGSIFFNRHQLLFKDPGRPRRDQGGLVSPEPGMGGKDTASGPELLTVPARGYLDGSIPITSGRTKADAVLEAVMTRYAPDAAFFGTAAQDYQSYLTLKP